MAGKYSDCCTAEVSRRFYVSRGYYQQLLSKKLAIADTLNSNDILCKGKLAVLAHCQTYRVLEITSRFLRRVVARASSSFSAIEDENAHNDRALRTK